MARDLSTQGQQLGVRFQLVNALPATTLVVFFGLVVLSGGLFGDPSLANLRTNLNEVGAREGALILFAILIVSLVTNSFQTGMVKILEGYWKPTGPLMLFHEIGLQRQARRRRHLDGVQSEQATLSNWHRWFLGSLPVSRRPDYQERAREWAESRLPMFPQAPQTPPAEGEEEDADRLMPTRLGNALRAAEDEAGDRFGLSAVAVASYLLEVASPDRVAVYEDARTELDVTVKFVYVWMACTIFGFAVFLPDGIWMIAPVVTLFLAWMSYRASTVAAREFGDVLAGLVRLYRFDLMEKLHWRLPWHMDDEVEQNRILWKVLTGDAEGLDRRSLYDHFRHQ